MIDLLLSILCSTLVYAAFKSFDKYGVNSFRAIVINYGMAAMIGFGSAGSLPNFNLTDPGSNYALILGVLFISLFNVMAITARTAGVAVVSVANKMAFIFPVGFAVWYWGDTLNAYKVLGIVIACAAVLLTAYKSNSSRHASDSGLRWALLLFIGSGVLDTLLLLGQEAVNGNESLFSASIFFVAFTLGVLYLLTTGQFRLYTKQDVWGGLILGTVNYGSIYFLLRAVGNQLFERSVVLPINNLGIILLSALFAAFVFREHLSKQNFIGISLACLSIYLMFQA
jgi:drug/metabolite transporter (DMT)-like permease